MAEEVKWTDEQKQAMYEKDSNILVAAAAGSGKTAVLVERIINKIINEKIDIDRCSSIRDERKSIKSNI